MGLIPATPVEKLLWIVLLLLLGGYLAGTWLNRRRSKSLGFWLQSGLGVLRSPLAANRTQSRGARDLRWKWMKTMSSGAQVTVQEAQRPFRQLEVTYLLLTREFAPLWGIELLRGKRDTLIIRGDLRSKPPAEFEVVPIRGKLRDTLDASAGDQPWQWKEMPAGLGLAVRAGASGDEPAARVGAFLQRYGPYIERLSLRDRRPNLILFARLTGIEHSPAAEFLEAVAKVVGTGPAAAGPPGAAGT